MDKGIFLVICRNIWYDKLLWWRVLSWGWRFVFRVIEQLMQIEQYENNFQLFSGCTFGLAFVSDCDPKL